MIKEAAKIMDINYNTAKTIVRTMKIDNRIYKKKKTSNKAFKVIEEDEHLVNLKRDLTNKVNLFFNNQTTHSRTFNTLNTTSNINECHAKQKQDSNINSYQNTTYKDNTSNEFLSLQNYITQVLQIKQEINLGIQEIQNQDRTIHCLLNTLICWFNRVTCY